MKNYFNFIKLVLVLAFILFAKCIVIPSDAEKHTSWEPELPSLLDELIITDEPEIIFDLNENDNDHKATFNIEIFTEIKNSVFTKRLYYQHYFFFQNHQLILFVTDKSPPTA